MTTTLSLGHFLLLLSLGLAIAEVTQKRTLSRQKRYLIFPQGSNVQLVYCLTIGAFAGNGDLVLGLTAALAYELPNKVDPKITKLHRQSRSVIFPKIEAFLQSTGLDGRACVLRAICEAAKRPNEAARGTFVQELLHAIFRLQDDQRFERADHRVYDFAHQAKTNCSEEYPTCPHSIYELDF